MRGGIRWLIARIFAVCLVILALLFGVAVIVDVVNHVVRLGVGLMVLGGCVFATSIGWSIFRQYRFEYGRGGGINSLPWPSGWRPASGAARILLIAGNLWTGLLLIGAGVMFSTYAVNYSMVIASCLFMAIGLGMVNLVVMIAATGFPAHRGKVTARISNLQWTGESAIWIPGPGVMRKLPWLSAVLFVTVLAIFAVAGVLFDMASLAIAVLLFGLIYLALMFLWRSQRRDFWLIPEGVVIRHNQKINAISWTAIRSIKEAEIEQYRGPSQRIITLSVKKENSLAVRWQSSGGASQYSATVDIDVTRLRCDPVLLCHCLKFYWSHPECRSELAGEAGRNRIVQGKVAE